MATKSEELKKKEERRINHALEFLKAYWFLVLFSLGIMGALITLWFELKYVVATVNPDALIEYNREQAILSTKREIRWCLGKAALKGKTAKEVLHCAD